MTRRRRAYGRQAHEQRAAEPSPRRVPPDGPPVSTIRHDREVPCSTYSLLCCITTDELRRSIGRTVTIQENLYDSTRRATVPQRRSRRRTKSLIQDVPHL